MSGGEGLVGRLLATTLLTVGLLATMLPASASAMPAAAGDDMAAPSFYDIFCRGVGARSGYEHCDNAHSIAPGRFLRIGLTSAGGRTVRFRAYNVDGDHKLGETGNMTAGGDRELVWRNDTGRSILVEMKADLQGLTGEVNVNARVHVTTF